MTVIPIGSLNQRLRLEAPVRTDDGAGGSTVTWSLVSEVWGAVRQTGGSERLDAGGLKQRNTHEIWIRWRSGVTADMRFLLDTRAFNIRAVVATSGRARFLKCLVEERVP